MMHESSILMMNLGEVLKLRKLDWRNGNKFCIKETGYEKMTLNELKNFRQLGSLTPGHPEVDFEVGIAVARYISKIDTPTKSVLAT